MLSKKAKTISLVMLISCRQETLGHTPNGNF